MPGTTQWDTCTPYCELDLTVAEEHAGVEPLPSTSQRAGRGLVGPDNPRARTLRADLGTGVTGEVHMAEQLPKTGQRRAGGEEALFRGPAFQNVWRAHCPVNCRDDGAVDNWDRRVNHRPPRAERPRTSMSAVAEPPALWERFMADRGYRRGSWFFIHFFPRDRRLSVERAVGAQTGGGGGNHGALGIASSDFSLHAREGQDHSRELAEPSARTTSSGQRATSTHTRGEGRKVIDRIARATAKAPQLAKTPRC